jgi:hypothetical protein
VTLLTRNVLAYLLAASFVLPACHDSSAGGTVPPADPAAAAVENSAELVREGQRVFRLESFGSETFWGDTLRVHETIAGAALGGVGPGVSPNAALAVGLKVDEDALPATLRSDLVNGLVDLDDPANTVALIELDAVVGLRGVFTGGALTSIGISCALCHSTVDDNLSAGIGHRRDGWPNRDLDVGQVISLAQDLTPFTQLLGLSDTDVRNVLASWGPGRFDAHLVLDGQAFRPDTATAAVLIPAALGLGGINLATYTGWGGVSHWNGFVANLEMHGQGRFYDPRLEDPVKFPIAAGADFGDVFPAAEDRVTPHLDALQHYQLSIPIPEPPLGSFDAAAADRGRVLFGGKADCARCHVPPLFTEPGFNAHTAAEIGIDDFQALRSPIEMYRTTPLRALFIRTEGGFYHDGRFADLPAVVEHYDVTFTLLLTPEEKADLVEYLKSI